MIKIWRTFTIFTLAFIAAITPMQLTMLVEGHNTKCIGEFVPKNELMIFDYQLLGDTSNAILEASFYSGYKFIKKVEGRNFHSESFKLEESTAMKVCFYNRGDLSLEIKMKLHSRAEINDFSNIATKNEHEMLESAYIILESAVGSSLPGTHFIESTTKEMTSRSKIQGLVVSFAGYAIGIIFIIGCAQVAFLKHQLRMKKVI